jgi:hypothetical protein
MIITCQVTGHGGERVGEQGLDESTLLAVSGRWEGHGVDGATWVLREGIKQGLREGIKRREGI